MMETTVLRDDSMFVLSLKITNITDVVQISKSKDFCIMDAIIFQVKNTAYNIPSNRTLTYYNIDSVRLELKNEVQCKYAIKLSCPEFKIHNRSLQLDDSGWRIINESNNVEDYNYNITIQVEPIGSLAPFAVLYDDPVTDFKLQCTDGSVAIHKSCLAAISPMFRSKLVENTSETESVMNLPNTDVLTLQNFKKCLYLNTLPEDNLERLLLLLSFFGIRLLEIRCVDKIMSNMQPAEALMMLEFALEHKLMALFLGIMENVQKGIIKVCDIRNNYLK